MRHHAGGIIRAVLQLAVRTLARRPPVTPAPEWEPQDRPHHCRGWNTNDARAAWRRVARRRAAKGYGCDQADKLETGRRAPRDTSL